MASNSCCKYLSGEIPVTMRGIAVRFNIKKRSSVIENFI